jgi:hypothetical protein
MAGRFRLASAPDRAPGSSRWAARSAAGSSRSRPRRPRPGSAVGVGDPFFSPRPGPDGGLRPLGPAAVGDRAGTRRAKPSAADPARGPAGRIPGPSSPGGSGRIDRVLSLDLVEVQTVGVITHDQAHPAIGLVDPHADLVIAAIQNHHVAVLQRRVIQVFPDVLVGHHPLHPVQVHPVDGHMQPLTTYQF